MDRFSKIPNGFWTLTISGKLCRSVIWTGKSLVHLSVFWLNIWCNFFHPKAETYSKPCQTSKVNLDIGLKKKKIWKAVLVMEEDRQAFGVILRVREVTLEEMFRYPVTSVPLSLAFPNSTLRQNPKHNIHYYLIEVSKACESTPLN